MILKQKILLYFSLIFLCSIKSTAQKNAINDSLKGFDSTSLKQFAVQNNLNSAEQTLLLSKKKRAFKNAKYNLMPLQINQSAKLISSNNSAMAGNLDFEAGNLSGWNITTSQNVNSIPIQTCCANSTILASALNSGTDTYFGFNLASPLGGNYIARLNSTTNMGFSVTTISNTVPVAASTNFLKIAGKYVFEGAFHNCNQQPYVNIKVTNLSGTTTLFSKFIQANEVSQGGLCSGANLNSQFFTNNPNLFFTNNNWDISCIDLSSLIGSSAIVEITVGECSQGGHGAYAYFDLLNTGFTPGNNTININNTSYSITSQPFNIGICNSNTAIAIVPSAATSYTWFGTGINGSNTQSVQINQPGSYSVVSTMTNNSGCSNLNNNIAVNFTVGTISPINVVANSTVSCGYSPVSFSLSGATSYSIASTSGYNNYTSSSNINVTPTITSSFFINGLTSLGCSATQTINVAVSPLPTITISGNNFCAGNTGTVIANGANTYTWVAVVSGNTVSTSNQLVLTPTASALYYVYGTNAAGCQSSFGFYTALSSPVLSVSPVPVVCLGNSVTLNASGSSIPSYTWSTGSNSPSITLSPTVTTTYTLSSNNGCGLISTPFTVTVNPVPTLSISGPTAVCPGQTYSWTGTGATSYSFSGISNYSGTNPTVSAYINSFTNFIAFTGSTANGCQGTTSLSVQVNTIPPVNMTTSTEMYGVCSGGSVTLYVPAGASSYSWNNGSTSYSTIVSPTIATNYSVVITGTNGCTASNFYVINVSGTTPTITPVSNNYTVCQGSVINVAQVANQCCNVTYSINNTVYPGNVTFYSPPSSGNYTLFATNPCGVNTTTFNVIVFPSPTVTISAPDSACKNSTVTFTLGGASSYNYYANSGNYTTTNTINSFTLYNSQTIQAYGTSVNGCGSAIPSPTYFVKALQPPSMIITPASSSVCAGSPITLSVSLTAASFSWSTGSLANAITLTPTANTVVSVTSTGTNGCSGSISKTITAVAIPTINAGASPTAVCVGNSTMLFCNGANTYTWSTGAIGNTTTVTPTVSSLYSVTGYSTNNLCPATKTVNVIVNPLPPVNFLQSQYSVCVGGTAVITATGATSYYYPYPGAGAGSLTIVNPPTTNTYIVTGTDNNGCSISVTTTLNVLPNPTLSVSNATTCSGAFTTLTASGANSYTWSSGAFTNTTSVNPPVSSQYTVTGADLNNCKDTQIGYVWVNPSPTLYVSASPTAVCVGNTSNLNVFGAATYTWSTGANTNAVAVTPSSTSVYSISGTSGSCISTKTIAVIVNTNTSIAVTSTNICIGNSANLVASNVATTYSWSTGAFTPSINVTPTVNTTYTVSGDDANGCFGSAIANVSVQPYPTITVTSSMPLICAGQSVTLTASGANTYTWSTLALGPAITATLFISTNFGVTGTSSFGCSTNTLFTQNVSLCTGIVGSSALETQQTIISPNPSTGIFNVNWPSITSNSKIEVSNSLGQLLFQQKILAENAVIDLSNYASGIYYLKVKQDDKQEVIKLIKE